MLSTFKNKILSVFDAKAMVLVVIIIGLFAPVQFTKAMEAQTIDSDSDGVVDMQEYAAGTNVVQEDTDQDGLADAEEMFDFMTDPLVPTPQLFSTDQILRFITPMNQDTVRGNVVLMKGLSKYADASMTFVFSHNGTKVTKEVKTDAKGLFQFEYALVEQCENKTPFDMSVHVGSQQMLLVHVTCEDISSLSIMEDARFDGRLVSELLASSEILYVPYGVSPTFYGHAKRDYFALGTFQSTLFSLGMIVDNDTVPVIFRPQNKLEQGKHTFTLTMRNVKKSEVYAPVHIPFTVDGTKRSFLSSAVVYSFGGMIFSMILGLSGGYYTRVLRKRMKLKGVA